MQTTSSLFTQLAEGDIRPLAWQLRISFTKAFDPSVVFFTLDQSLLDGTDILAGSDGSVIQEWDKYEYADFTDRVISIQVEAEQSEPYSIVRGMADITLNNYDNYFTPNSESPIEGFILPKRPIRILLGFGTEVVPVFIGLTESMPEIDRQSKTARFHCIDFMTFLFDKKIDQTVLLENQNTGEILEYLLDHLGLLPSQYDIDSTSFNRIDYFFVDKNVKFGEIAKQLMQAEQGRLWMDETGVIRFLNRQNYPTVPVLEFNTSNTTTWSNSSISDVINSTVIKSNVLGVQPLQSVWELAEPIIVPAGQTISLFADFQDPVTDVNAPTEELAEIENSYYISDIAGDVDISLTVFSKSALLEIENTGSDVVTVQNINLWGTPVRVVDRIQAEYADATSVNDLEEQLYEFETKYIQTQEKAESIARTMVLDYKDYGSIVELEVKGNPALQIGDLVTLDLEGYTGDYIVTKIVWDYTKGFRQKLIVKKRVPITYFILDQSLLDGSDLLL